MIFIDKIRMCVVEKIEFQITMELSNTTFIAGYF